MPEALALADRLGIERFVTVGVSTGSAYALALAIEVFGADGSKMMTQTGGTPLPPADMALLTNPDWLMSLVGSLREMFAQGVAGYTDDRLADGPGWGTFDVAAIRCPVTVLHGGSDTIVPVAHAHHTAKIVPGAKLRIVGELGHFSIAAEVVGAVRELLSGGAQPSR